MLSQDKSRIDHRGNRPACSALNLPPWAEQVLKSPAFVMFICGPRDSGKTDLGLKIAESLYIKFDCRHIATNIHTESYMIEQQITNYPDLSKWLKTPGKKLFVLDELGKAMGKMDFMTKLTKEIMKVVELVWHFDCGLVGIAPSERVVNTTFLNNDLLDLKVVKRRSKTEAKLTDLIHRKSINLVNINRTSILYDRKDIATFTLTKEIFSDSDRPCCQVASMRARGMTYDQICREMGWKSRNSVREKIIEHLAHTL